MSRHTPGPWHVGGSGSASAKGADRVWGPDGAAVCAISTRRMLGANEAPEEVANAKLIASAPEQQAKIDALADALEAVFRDFRGDSACRNDNPDACDDKDCWPCRGREALLAAGRLLADASRAKGSNHG